MPPTITQALSDENLYSAWVKVNMNQGCAGIDGEDLATFDDRLWMNLQNLRNEVQHDTYRPKPLLRVNTPKSSGTGTRPLSIPAVRDRVLQTAVALILTPVFELKFEEVSFAYRKGRSVDQAVRMVVRLRDQGFKWVVDADIKSYFDEVDHKLLMAEIKKLVDDPSILRLIKQWLSVTVVDGKQRFKLKKGIPQGSPISPLLANLFLDQLDDSLLQRNLRIVRYADDFVVLCKSEKRAEKALEITAEVLDTLKLRFNEDKTSITDFNRGFRFLGVDFIRSFTFIEGKVRNSRLIMRRYARNHGLPEFDSAARQLGQVIKKIKSAENLDQLRGYEGNAARIYFQAIASALDPVWRFGKRIKNPPTDPINALLSYGYTILFYNIYSLLRLHGLNPQVGFLHPIRMGHPALASDVMEEFRSLIVDSVVLNLIFNERLNIDDFRWPDTNQPACWIEAAAKRKFIKALEQKFNAPVTHPNSGLKIDYRRAIAHQVRQLTAVIRGTESKYQAMILR